MCRFVARFTPIAVCALFAGCAANTSIRLQPEQRTVLHVGQIATVELTVDRKMNGTAGDALSLVRERKRRDTTTFVYRAVQPGNHVFITAPDVPEGGCISCVTVHYFVSVVQ